MRRLHLHGLLLVQVRRATADLVVNSDAKVANRDTKVWHFVIENGYPKISLSRCSGDTITLLYGGSLEPRGVGQCLEDFQIACYSHATYNNTQLHPLQMPRVVPAT